MKSSKFNIQKVLSAFFIFNFAFLIGAKAQEVPPKPSAPRATKIPLVTQKKMPNGLTVATAERKNVPLVTVQLVVKNGANSEVAEEAGLANMTASMLTKGTKTRSASQIAEQIEFLGGAINSGAGWNSSIVTLTVMSDKLDAALAVMSDVVLNPTFKKEEIDLLKSQTLDGLAYNLQQPGFLATYVASKYTYGEHPAGGTPDSINKLTREDITNFYQVKYNPRESVLIFAGDIAPARANALAQKFFGRWRNSKTVENVATIENQASITPAGNTLQRILVIDDPNAGQASVNYLTAIKQGRTQYITENGGRSGGIFYPSLVFNSVLGGGYSSRLNQEIRIKRGLSYGAGSSFNWRTWKSNFGARAQTKNESAAEVAELLIEEIQRLKEKTVSANELAPRKLVLTGDFGRELETSASLAQMIATLYTYQLPLSELNSHINSVNGVTDAQIKSFAAENLKNGDIIIVGNYNAFKRDLAKRFPQTYIEVIEADQLDMSKENLRK